MENKVAFVTGAGKVTGKHIALKLSEAGYILGISYVNSKDGADETVSRIEKMGGIARSYRVDTRDLEGVNRVFDEFTDEFGRFDLLVNNAGITRFSHFLEVTEELYDNVIDTNLKGTYFTAQAAARRMKAFGNGGVIINISSVHAGGTWPGDTMYATTKAGINRLSEAMALDLAEDRIRVVGVAPGYINMIGKEIEQSESAKDVMKRIPLHRYAEPDEIGDACVFLASDKAAYITGSTLYIEGGVLLPVITDNKYV
jgi:NAD(P)-dependent dehydrogenase (short-subunit alcohol dehydrogenase family)